MGKNIKKISDLANLTPNQVKHFIGNRFKSTRPVKNNNKLVNTGDVCFYRGLASFNLLTSADLSNCSNSELFVIRDISSNGTIKVRGVTQTDEYIGRDDINAGHFIVLSKLNSTELEKFIGGLSRLNMQNFKNFTSFGRVSKNIVKQIAYMIPEEKFEIVPHFESNGQKNISIDIIVHLDKFDITNSIESKYTVRDMFIKFSIGFDPKAETFILRDIHVTRMTFDINDFFINGYIQSYPYIQSHVSHSSRNGIWHINVCYGETRLSRAVYTHKTTFKSIEDLPILIMNFIDFMKWESIEGTPFFRIETLGRQSKDKNHKSSAQIVREADNLIKKVLLNNSIEQLADKLELDYKGNKVILTGESSDILKDIIEQEASDKERVYVDSSGMPIKIPDDKSIGEFKARAIQALSVLDLTQGIRFKGKHITPKIIESVKERSLESYSKKVHPAVYAGIQSRIEDKLTQTLNTLI